MKTAEQVLDDVIKQLEACPLGVQDLLLVRGPDTTDSQIALWLLNLHQTAKQPVQHTTEQPHQEQTSWGRRLVGPSPRFQQMAFRLRELDSVLQAEGVQLEPKQPMFDPRNNLGLSLMPATLEALNQMYPGLPYPHHPIQLVSKLLRESANIVAESRSINNTLHNHVDDWLSRAQNLVRDETEFASLKLTLLAPTEIDGIEHYNVQVEEHATVKDITAVRQPGRES